ncbi:hypothetical protein DFJ74DRAFT_690382 [Hyaloraphidium curvatum]|nr:hypothetical protein DFJ74DRAFT_690382 [Hyaloraphidium curvatum]
MELNRGGIGTDQDGALVNAVGAKEAGHCNSETIRVPGDVDDVRLPTHPVSHFDDVELHFWNKLRKTAHFDRQHVVRPGDGEPQGCLGDTVQVAESAGPVARDVLFEIRRGQRRGRCERRRKQRFGPERRQELLSNWVRGHDGGQRPLVATIVLPFRQGQPDNKADDSCDGHRSNDDEHDGSLLHRFGSGRRKNASDGAEREPAPTWLSVGRTVKANERGGEESEAPFAASAIVMFSCLECTMFSVTSNRQSGKVPGVFCKVGRPGPASHPEH